MLIEITKTMGTAAAIAALTAIPVLIAFEPTCVLIAFASAFAGASAHVRQTDALSANGLGSRVARIGPKAADPSRVHGL